MATIIKEILIEARADDVWDTVRDFGAVDKRLAAGFVTDCKLDGDARVVTFFNGLVAREPLVSLDEARRRLVYGASGGRTTHYNASVQISAEGGGRTRFVWIIDLLPNELAAPIGAMAEAGASAIKRTLEAAARRV
ncbi:MAG TPA: SRPBCC family protein [Xanthobacteraceae bacterium]|nr:SRPBCC family protein [Xanthobacteraceae bacterium]